MKICKFIFLAILLCGNFFTANVFATDLIDIYKDALKNDPQFKAARARWLAEKENIAINRSTLLPQIIAEGNLSRNFNKLDIESLSVDNAARYYNNQAGYTLQLTQSIFDFGNWAKVWGAKAAAKSAYASFLSAKEELILRTAKAYFAVLQAKDILNYAKKNKEATNRLFVQAKHKHDVGLTPITDLEEARTKYDVAVAEEIKAINNVDDNLEKLSEITQVRYDKLYPLKKNMPLLSPEPSNIESWSKAAEKQNLDLLAARFATIANRENIKVQNAGHLPILSMQGNYNYAYGNNHQGTSLRSDNRTASGILKVQIPIFQGGGVVASAKRAGYQYQEASANQEKTHREVVSKTRQSYLGVISSISKVKADRQAIKSAQSSLRANRASYSVGARTMSDVLTAQTQLFDVQKTYAQDEYGYILQLLQLKKFTGILGTEDLQQINMWLKTPKNRVVQKPTAKKPKVVVINSNRVTAAKTKNKNRGV